MWHFGPQNKPIKWAKITSVWKYFGRRNLISVRNHMKPHFQYNTFNINSIFLLISCNSKCIILPNDPSESSIILPVDRLCWPAINSVNSWNVKNRQNQTEFRKLHFLAEFCCKNLESFDKLKNSTTLTAKNGNQCRFSFYCLEKGSIDFWYFKNLHQI